MAIISRETFDEVEECDIYKLFMYAEYYGIEPKFYEHIFYNLLRKRLLTKMRSLE